MSIAWCSLVKVKKGNEQTAESQYITHQYMEHCKSNQLSKLHLVTIITSYGIEKQEPKEHTYLAKSKKTNASLRDSGVLLLTSLNGGFLRSTMRTPSSSLNTTIETTLLFTISKNFVFASSPQPSSCIGKKKLLRMSENVKIKNTNCN